MSKMRKRCRCDLFVRFGYFFQYDAFQYRCPLFSKNKSPIGESNGAFDIHIDFIQSQCALSFSKS